MHTSAHFPQPIRIPVDGIELEVFEAGIRSDRKPVVLCHGWPGHAFSWRHQIRALAAAGYHVLVPNQRGYGNSSRPAEVSAYGLEHLTSDLVALLDHYGYDDAVFVGHDWGANVVWGLAQLHPRRVHALVALSVPYMERGDTPWVAWMEAMLGDQFYFVHFNRYPGVADAVLDANPRRFLRNLYRKNLPPTPPGPGNAMIRLAETDDAVGDPVLTEAELDVYVRAFQASGFGPGIHWYRNVDRNWHLLGEVDPVVHQPALMIYGDRDTVMQAPRLQTFVPNVEVRHLDCGHWIQEELPEQTNALLLQWLDHQGASPQIPLAGNSTARVERARADASRG